MVAEAIFTFLVGTIHQLPSSTDWCHQLVVPFYTVFIQVGSWFIQQHNRYICTTRQTQFHALLHTRRKVPELPVFHMGERSEEHTSELQSLMRISYAVFCLKKKKI